MTATNLNTNSLKSLLRYKKIYSDKTEQLILKLIFYHINIVVVEL